MKKITEAAFGDWSAAYDTVDHCRLLKKTFEIMEDQHLTELPRILRTNLRFFVEF